MSESMDMISETPPAPTVASEKLRYADVPQAQHIRYNDHSSEEGSPGFGFVSCRVPPPSPKVVNFSFSLIWEVAISLHRYGCPHTG